MDVGFINGFVGGGVLNATQICPASIRRLRTRRVPGCRRIVVRCQDETTYLSEENVNIVLEEAKIKLGTLFGNSEENREVGITGDVDLAELEGVTVVLRLTGRFWHKRSDVLARVAQYLQDRIPEICDVVIEDESQLDDADERVEKLRL